MLNERMHVVCYTLVRQYCLKKKSEAPENAEVSPAQTIKQKSACC